MMKRRTHKTRRLILRPYRIEDYPSWFDAYVNRLPRQNKFDRGPLPKSKCRKVDFRNMMRRQQKLAQKDEIYAYGVFEAKTGILVGAVDIFIMVRNWYQMGNLGYQIHNRHVGKGYGREAAKAALKIGFKDLKLNRLEAAIIPANRRSIRLAKSIGMRREGIKRRYLVENDKWTDHVVFVANPQDFRFRK